jgi:hypothetical protein
LSHESLPDWRIEKAAVTALNGGHEVFFGGRYPNNYTSKIFPKIYRIDWTAKARFAMPVYWGSVKKQVEGIIKEVKPDIVHAHNLFSAKMISEFGIPFVYDDHEYWSSHANLLKEMIGNLFAIDRRRPFQSAINLAVKVRRTFIIKYAIYLWSKWESEIVSSHPTLTVSDQVAEQLRTRINNCKRIFVVPNFPLRTEVRGLKEPVAYTKLSCAYAGGDGLNKEKYPNRNIDGLPELFCKQDIGDLTIIGWDGPSSEKVRYKGYLQRGEMYAEMSKHSIGLIPWKKHWSHVFVSPNKAYEYAHSGLFVMCTDSFKAVPETLNDNCATFEDYASLASQLNYFKRNPADLYDKRVKIFNFAQENLIWEKKEKDILRAYQLC